MLGANFRLFYLQTHSAVVSSLVQYALSPALQVIAQDFFPSVLVALQLFPGPGFDSSSTSLTVLTCGADTGCGFEQALMLQMHRRLTMTTRPIFRLFIFKLPG